VDMIWDVVNEPVHCRAWGNWDKPNRYDDEPLDEVYRYVADALRWAHEANPNAPLLVNEYDLFVDKKMQDMHRKSSMRSINAGRMTCGSWGGYPETCPVVNRLH
jgi:GH35 family endo-1,4-beta-xylanase